MYLREAKGLTKTSQEELLNSLQSVMHSQMFLQFIFLLTKSKLRKSPSHFFAYWD